MNNERGYSLLETLIALALLLGVLLPGAVFLGFAANNALASDKTTALNLGRSEMEYIISSEMDSSFVRQQDQWWIRRSITNDSALVHITVSVFKFDTLNAPVLEFETYRLWYP
ncbi:MAG: prepilin-type N-terminal cleavage/methylation domain-containing protein [Bacteroidota bacterium]